MSKLTRFKVFLIGIVCVCSVMTVFVCADSSGSVKTYFDKNNTSYASAGISYSQGTLVDIIGYSTGIFGPDRSAIIEDNKAQMRAYKYTNGNSTRVLNVYFWSSNTPNSTKSINANAEYINVRVDVEGKSSNKNFR